MCISIASAWIVLPFIIFSSHCLVSSNAQSSDGKLCCFCSNFTLSVISRPCLSHFDGGVGDSSYCTWGKKMHICLLLLFFFSLLSSYSPLDIFFLICAHFLFFDWTRALSLSLSHYLTVLFTSGDCVFTGDSLFYFYSFLVSRSFFCECVCVSLLLSCAKFDLLGQLKGKERPEKTRDREREKKRGPSERMKSGKEEVKNVTKCSQVTFKVTLSSIHQTVYHMAIKWMACLASRPERSRLTGSQENESKREKTH